MNSTLNSNDELTQLIISKNIKSWPAFLEAIRKLPYGRNSSRTDFSLVLKEGKGTCSSKHALLKKVADLNGIPGVKLILGIYYMSRHNTPRIGNALDGHPFDGIPEAHCYLKINEKRIDATAINSDIGKIVSDLELEIEISPEQVIQYKVNFHKNYMKTWLQKNDLPYSLDEIWAIREDCIRNLELARGHYS